MPEPDFARMAMPHRLGTIALSSGGGAALGVVGTFAHQSLPPVGVAIALATVAVYIVGLRAWAGVRTPAAAGSVGLAAVIGPLSSASNGSVLIPANALGYTWLGGIAVIAFLALAWPRIQRVPQPTADTMETTRNAVSPVDPPSR